MINQHLRTAWEDQRSRTLVLRPPTANGAGGFYLDVIGRTPTLAELRGLLAKPLTSGSVGSVLVDRLLGEEYLEEYARQLHTTVWTNLLIGRTGGDEQRQSLANRSGMRQYLRRSFQKQQAARPDDDASW